MADLADMIRQMSYYQAGGKDEGMRDIDKVNSIFGTANKGVDAYLDTIRGVLRNKQLELDNQKSKRELDTGREPTQSIEMTFGRRPDQNITAGTETVISRPQTSNVPQFLEKYKHLPVEEGLKLAYAERSLQPRPEAIPMAAKPKTQNVPQTPPVEPAKQLTANNVIAVNEGRSVAEMLPDVEKAIETNKDIFGPVGGTLRSLNPYDERSRTLESQLRTSSQSFGKFMEGGVLRKEDEEKYRRMFPQLGDTYQVAQNKLAIVRRLLAQKYQSVRGDLQGSGYDVSGLGEIPVPPSLFEGGTSSEIKRKTADGRVAIFDANKQFLRYE